jgi:hypothetical protein
MLGSSRQGVWNLHFPMHNLNQFELGESKEKTNLPDQFKLRFAKQKEVTVIKLYQYEIASG